ncbi:hypothetical protein CLAIMM_07924 [Cladophialophora immunda]|nr:hypothetical protein CLAIMM_07924 [Cladophialophora immunda]
MTTGNGHKHREMVREVDSLCCSSHRLGRTDEHDLGAPLFLRRRLSSTTPRSRVVKPEELSCTEEISGPLENDIYAQPSDGHLSVGNARGGPHIADWQHIQGKAPSLARYGFK